MPKQPIDQKEGIKRLAEYWFRAELMRQSIETIRDHYDNDLERIRRSSRWWDFKTYLAYWLSGLFVVVEGFNKLGLKDKEVSRLFNANIGALKKFRHETYHFALKGPLSPPAPLSWADDLHEAIGSYLKIYIGKMAVVESDLKKRARWKARKIKQAEKKRKARGGTNGRQP